MLKEKNEKSEKTKIEMEEKFNNAINKLEKKFELLKKNYNLKIPKINPKLEESEDLKKERYKKILISKQIYYEKKLLDAIYNKDFISLNNILHKNDKKKKLKNGKTLLQYAFDLKKYNPFFIILNKVENFENTIDSLNEFLRKIDFKFCEEKLYVSKFYKN